MTTILITGITGFLGSHAARELCDGHTVVGLVRSSSDLSRISDLSKSAHLRLVEHASEVVAEFRPSVILHCAVAYGGASCRDSVVIDTNIELPMRLAELGAIHGAAKFIHIDSFFSKFQGSYEYLSSYQRSKLQVLEWFRELAKSITIQNVRLEHVYGVHDKIGKAIPTLVRRICSNESRIELTAGEQKRDFVYVTDVARALRLITEQVSGKPRMLETIEVGTGKSTTLRRLLELTKELSGSTSELGFGDLPARIGEPVESKADTRILNELGWQPNISTEDGVRLLIEECRRER